MISSPRSTFIAYGTLGLAIVLWLLVGYFAWVLPDMRAAYAERIQKTTQQSDKDSADLRLRVAATESRARAQALNALLAADVPDITGAIRAVGVRAGVPVTINTAVPSTVPGAPKDVHAIAFVVEANGSLEALLRAVALFESLPIPSTIDIVDLTSETEESARAGEWRLNIKLQVLTTASVS